MADRDWEIVLKRCAERRFWAKEVGRLGCSVRSEMVLRTRGSRVK
jgi:Cys-tRNA synthase (O-phospho-L-seryl-tRNA:Cys-tRNA synthase)